VLDFLERIGRALPLGAEAGLRVFLTGSGAQPLTSVLSAPFVQEVNALTLAVERLYPDANAVVELGGQDAKMIVFKDGPAGQRRAWTSMNDRCAAGTGATIDKCLIKVDVREALQPWGLTLEQARALLAQAPRPAGHCQSWLDGSV
jgi:activator of 2-hydroxyglutaryl-CoA dehydratase